MLTALPIQANPFVKSPLAPPAGAGHLITVDAY